MRLYYTKRSPYARKVRVVALEKNIKLELIEEDLTNKSTHLISANPLGKIPSLVLEDQSVLCDSSLICDYFEELVLSPKLIPQNRKWIILNLDAISKGLFDITVGVFYEKTLHPNDINQKFIQSKEESILRTLKYFEKHISHLKDFTLASISVGCAVGYINLRAAHLWSNADKEYPNLTKWYNEIIQRPSFVETMPVVS